MKQLVLGGARSGKSRYAEQLAEAQGKRLIYCATATAGDEEMAARIRHHQARRGEAWKLVEEPLALAQTLRSLDSHLNSNSNTIGQVIVVDCLTLWVSNCLHQDCFDQQRTELLQALPVLSSEVILISNEVGSGIVPLGQLSRDFVDASGWLHQRLAELCDQVTLVVAGLPLVLKSNNASGGVKRESVELAAAVSAIDLDS